MILGKLKVCSKVRAVGHKTYVGLAAAGSALGFNAAAKAEPVALPTVFTDVNISGHIEGAITALGTVAVTAVGGYFAFLVIRMALRWGRTAVR